jgi:hypothetical protein
MSWKGLGSFIEIESIDRNATIGKQKLLDQCGQYLVLFGIMNQIWYPLPIAISYCKSGPVCVPLEPSTRPEGMMPTSWRAPGPIGRNLIVCAGTSTKKLGSKVARACRGPKMASSGAKTIEEYVQWAGNLCGMACLKMILATRTGRAIPMLELSRKCTEYGGYTVSPTGQIKGLIYAPFVRFIRNIPSTRRL